MMKSTTVLKGVLAVSILLGSAVSAQASGKYEKKEAEVAVTQTELTKPAQKPAVHGPVLRAKAFLPEKTEAVKDVTDRQIVLMEKLNAKTSESDSEKPELLFRLAQLYEEQARYFNFRARALDEEIFQEKAGLNSI